MADSIQEFEDQLEQEELAKNREELSLTDGDEFTAGGILYRRDADGTVFEFDPDKKAWFPKIDEDFIASYQMNYGTENTVAVGCPTNSADGNTDATVYSNDYWSNPPADINSEEYRVWYEQYCSYFCPAGSTADGSNVSATSEVPTAADEAVEAFVKATGADNPNAKGGVVGQKGKEPLEVKNQAGKKRKKEKDLVQQKPAEPPAWFELEDDKNTNVYVSGLPDDITEDEYREFMTKVGVIAYDPILRKPKLKLYTNDDGTYKGDGRCCYVKAESVDLALHILDGADIRGHVVSVERARFELKGRYDPSKKKRKMTKQEKKKYKEKQEKILGWQPEKVEDTRPRHERIVVIKHAFLPEQFEKDPRQINEVSADFREECKKFGEVRKVTVYDRHPEGVVTVTFKEPEQADECITAINRRWFAGRMLEAANWDGRTKYLIKETQEEMDKRLSKWHTFIEGESKPPSPAVVGKDEKKTENSENGQVNAASDDSAGAVTQVNVSTSGSERVPETDDKTVSAAVDDAVTATVTETVTGVCDIQTEPVVNE